MPTSDERRVVTVLFAAVPGITQLGESMSAEDAAEAADALFMRFRRVVESRGGTVDKFAGDDMMAVFGAPIAHEDDPVRAVRAALAMRRELDLFNAQRSLALTFRAGVNLGEVLWGTVGGDRPTAMGDAVNVAQRLEAGAAPGTVMASRAVERAASTRIEFGPERELQLRNRQESIMACEALGERKAGEAATPSATPLIGRERELAQLTALPQPGRGAFVVIEGESGVGKSRLVLDARRAFAARPGAWVGVGHSIEGSRVPLAPFAEIVRFAARASSLPGTPPAAATGTWLAGVLQGVVAAEAERGALATLMIRSMGSGEGETGTGGRSAADPGRIKKEIEDAWLKWARSLAARGPILIVVEDVHWADAGTLTLLDRLAETLGSSTAAIIATSRPPVRGAPPILRKFERIKLAELSVADCGTMARGLFAAEVDPELAEFLAERSGGNPLFLEELAGWLREEGLVGGDPVRFERRPHTLPDGLRGLLVARIDAVSPDARESLKCGSVFGRAFWSGATTLLAGRDVVPGVLQAERGGIVDRHSVSLLPDDEEYLFRQTPLRDAAYSLLTRKERQRLHARAAELMEGLAPRLGRRAAILAASHRESAGQVEEAARLWLRASADALDEAAYEESLGHARESQRLRSSPEASLAAVQALINLGLYDMAVAEAEEVCALPAATRSQWLIARRYLSTVHDRQGRFAESLKVLDEIQGEAAGAGMGMDVARLRLGVLVRLSRFEEALQLATRLQADAEELLAKSGRREGLSSLFSAIQTEARVHYQMGRHEQSLAAYQRALEVGREKASPSEIAISQNGLGMTLRGLGRIEEAQKAYEAALASFRESASRWHIAMVLTNLSGLAIDQGEIDKGFELGEEALTIRRELGDRWGEAMLLSNKGSYKARLGFYEEALEGLKLALAIRRETGDRQGSARTLLNFCNARFDTGDLEGALSAAQEAAAVFLSTGQHAMVLQCHSRSAVALMALGRKAEALRSIDDALDLAEKNFASHAEAEFLRTLRALFGRTLRGAATPSSAVLNEEGTDVGMIDAGVAAFLSAEAGDAAASRAALATGRERLASRRDLHYQFFFRVLEVRALKALGDPAAVAITTEAESHARGVGAKFWEEEFRAAREGKGSRLLG